MRSVLLSLTSESQLSRSYFDFVVVSHERAELTEDYDVTSFHELNRSQFQISSFPKCRVRASLDPSQDCDQERAMARPKQ